MNDTLLHRIVNGRTDLVADLIASGTTVDAVDSDGVSILKWCAYYGDVGSIRLLLSQGASLNSLGENLDLNGAAFHGHWKLCQFLIEQGATANHALLDTGETPLHAALCRYESITHGRVVEVLLRAGADPNLRTLPSAETGCFMRDARTRAETSLHRAAAFGSEHTIRLLLDAGAQKEILDGNGDSPLSWASWHLRPASILRLLCYGNFRIHPDHTGMEQNLLGRP